MPDIDPRLLQMLMEKPTLSPQIIEQNLARGNVQALINSASSDADLLAIRGAMERRGLFVPKDLQWGSFSPQTYKHDYSQPPPPINNPGGMSGATYQRPVMTDISPRGAAPSVAPMTGMVPRGKYPTWQ